MRQFSTVFGTSELAVATVLSAYMGGLALGAALAGKFIDRSQAPGTDLRHTRGRYCRLRADGPGAC